MADIEVERKDNKGNNDGNRGRNDDNRSNNNGNRKKWWVGTIIAVVIFIILLMILNDRTDFSMDDEPYDQTENDTTVFLDKASSKQTYRV